jgi:glycosyltransferase involved in cell wall biosynthesis
MEIMEDIKFSIIIPVYNTPEELLRRCLESIVNQDYTNFEVICINDGSTDNSLNVLNQYAEKFSVVKVISKKNGGISSARNAGINEAATSDYMLFIDHDDYYM